MSGEAVATERPAVPTSPISEPAVDDVADIPPLQDGGVEDVGPRHQRQKSPVRLSRALSSSISHHGDAAHRNERISELVEELATANIDEKGISAGGQVSLGDQQGPPAEATQSNSALANAYEGGDDYAEDNNYEDDFDEYSSNMSGSIRVL
eukprot:scaffold128333_cov23-Prasinocladus_malaysianus.AAC.1